MFQEMPRGSDLFASTAEVLVNPVNTRGVMGAGLAREFKRRWPAMFDEYYELCVTVRGSKLPPGGIHVWTSGGPGVPVVANLATKDDWRRPSQYAWIRSGLEALRWWCEREGVGSVACPAIGAGLGGLDEEQVRRIAEEVFGASSKVLLIWYPGR